MKNKKEFIKKLLIYIIVIALIVAIDQITKAVARSSLIVGKENAIEVIKNFFYITLLYNTGAAWNFLNNNTLLLTIISVIASVGISIYYFASKEERTNLESVTLALIIAGAIGNGIDRIIAAKVTDFLDFYIFGYDFPIFNIADCAEVIGIGLLIIAIIIDEVKENNEVKRQLEEQEKKEK